MDWFATNFCSKGVLWLALRGHPLPLIWAAAIAIFHSTQLLITLLPRDNKSLQQAICSTEQMASLAPSLSRTAEQFLSALGLKGSGMGRGGGNYWNKQLGTVERNGWIKSCWLQHYTYFIQYMIPSIQQYTTQLHRALLLLTASIFTWNVVTSYYIVFNRSYLYDLMQVLSCPACWLVFPSCINSIFDHPVPISTDFIG